MKILNTKALLLQEPREIDRYLNQIGQEVILYEDPIRGDQAPIIALVEGVAIKTDLFDSDDFHFMSEHNPIYLNNEVKYAFDLEDNDKFILLAKEFIETVVEPSVKDKKIGLIDTAIEAIMSVSDYLEEKDARMLVDGDKSIVGKLKKLGEKIGKGE